MNLNYEGFEQNLVRHNEPDWFSKKTQYVFKFDNGYGASVIKGEYTYGHEDDQWELAVIIFDEYDNYELCYTTEITNDVIGWLSDEEVRNTLQKIKNL